MERVPGAIADDFTGTADLANPAEGAVFATEEPEETAWVFPLLQGMNTRALTPEQLADNQKPCPVNT